MPYSKHKYSAIKAFVEEFGVDALILQASKQPTWINRLFKKALV